jgi:hypothetical protein
MLDYFSISHLDVGQKPRIANLGNGTTLGDELAALFASGLYL